jgi:hypothetical protein
MPLWHAVVPQTISSLQKKPTTTKNNTPHFPMRNTPLKVKRPFLSVYNIKPLFKLQSYNFLFCWKLIKITSLFFQLKLTVALSYVMHRNVLPNGIKFLKYPTVAVYAARSKEVLFQPIFCLTSMSNYHIY